MRRRFSQDEQNHCRREDHKRNQDPHLGDSIGFGVKIRVIRCEGMPRVAKCNRRQTECRVEHRQEIPWEHLEMQMTSLEKCINNAYQIFPTPRKSVEGQYLDMVLYHSEHLLHTLQLLRKTLHEQRDNNEIE